MKKINVEHCPQKSWQSRLILLPLCSKVCRSLKRTNHQSHTCIGSHDDGSIFKMSIFPYKDFNFNALHLLSNEIAMSFCETTLHWATITNFFKFENVNKWIWQNFLSDIELKFWNSTWRLSWRRRRRRQRGDFRFLQFLSGKKQTRCSWSNVLKSLTTKMNLPPASNNRNFNKMRSRFIAKKQTLTNRCKGQTWCRT